MQVPRSNSPLAAALTLYYYQFENMIWGLECMSEIINDQLAVGSIVSAADRDFLKTRGITHIVSVTQFGTAVQWFPDDFEYLVLDVQDTVLDELGSHLSKCVDFIDRAIAAGGKVLVHCNQGRSRSVTVAAAYLTVGLQCPVDEALALIKSKRPIAEPNAGFLRQLHQWHDEKNHKDV